MQAGAPGQAAMRRRGSSASTINPSSAHESTSEARRAASRPTIRNARQGVSLRPRRVKRPRALDQRLEPTRLDFAEGRRRADDDARAEFARAEDVAQRSASSRTRARRSSRIPPWRTRLRRLSARPARASAAAPLRLRRQARGTRGRAAPRLRRSRRTRIARPARRRRARNTANVPSRNASKRISASTSPSGRRPCASRTKLNFAGRRRRRSSSLSRVSSAATLGPRDRAKLRDRDRPADLTRCCAAARPRGRRR